MQQVDLTSFSFLNESWYTLMHNERIMVQISINFLSSIMINMMKVKETKFTGKISDLVDLFTLTLVNIKII
jgi:hypothetical protein